MSTNENSNGNNSNENNKYVVDNGPNCKNSHCFAPLHIVNGIDKLFVALDDLLTTKDLDGLLEVLAPAIEGCQRFLQTNGQMPIADFLAHLGKSSQLIAEESFRLQNPGME